MDSPIRTSPREKGLGTQWDRLNGGTETKQVECPRCGADYHGTFKHGRPMDPACPSCMGGLAKGNRPHVRPRNFSPRSSTGRARAF